MPPSGDQLGVPVNSAFIDVSCRQFSPCLSQLHICRLPPREDSKAILLPSGEYRGAKSLRVEAMSGVGFSTARPPSRSPKRQMLTGPREHTKKSQPCGSSRNCWPRASANLQCDSWVARAIEMALISAGIVPHYLAVVRHGTIESNDLLPCKRNKSCVCNLGVR